MNAAGLKGFATAHKKELLAGGAGVAVLFGLRARSKAGGSNASTPATTTAGSTAPMPSAGGTGYDSSSSDVYNALQPQIEQTQSMIQRLIDQLQGTPVPTTPTPVPNPATPPALATRVHADAALARRLRHATPIPIPRVVHSPSPAKPPGRVYVVRQGDNLSSIAARLGIAGGSASGWQSLYAANRTVIGGNANLIKAGQRLVY